MHINKYSDECLDCVNLKLDNINEEIPLTPFFKG